MFSNDRGSLVLIASMVAGLALLATAAACSDDDRPDNATAHVGGISGTLAYPGDASDGGPSQAVVAFNRDTGSVHHVLVARTGPYTLKELPPGVYHVVAYAFDRAGGYSRAVACGLGVSCTDHALVDVVVRAGAVTAGVDPVDWYAPQGSFPARPAEVALPDGDPTPPAGCGAPSDACEFAARLERFASTGDADAFALVIHSGKPASFVCDGERGDFRLYPLCTGALAGEERLGYPQALHGSEGGAVAADDLAATVGRHVRVGATLASIGCDAPACETFAAAFALGDGQPAVFYLAFDRDASLGAYFLTGFGLSGDNAETILRGGTTGTVAGEITFTPWPEGDTSTTPVGDE